MNNPVLLLPGYSDKASDLVPMATHLRHAGHRVYTFGPQPSDGTLPLEELAQQLARYIEETFGASQPLDLVGFSMGGLVCRYFVQRLGGAARVKRLVTLATPHQGTLITYLLNHKPGLCQMQPSSPFLAELNGELAPLEEVDFTSIWTPLDLTVMPASSSELPVGRMVKLLLPHHRSLLTSQRSFAAVLTELKRTQDGV